MARYYIIAGESSGDLHGSNLIRAIFRLDPAGEIRAWGGDKMITAGAKVVKHYRDLAFMGFVEVVANLNTILKNLRFCKKDILAFRPDALILVDYPGFNLRIAKWAKTKGIPVYYYISPQVWAWKSKRVFTIRDTVQKMLCILPFEKDFYAKYQIEVEYVGHPLLEAIDESGNMIQRISSGKPIIALLPGSRKQEVEKLLNVMLDMVPLFPNYQFVIAGVSHLPREIYHQCIAAKSLESECLLLFDQTYEILKSAYAACVTSGTATLETALFQVPQVVCYRGSKLSYLIAKKLINIEYISLVNLILDQPVVTELIQKDFTQAKLQIELSKILDKNSRAKIITAYQRLRTILHSNGTASENTARLIISDTSSAHGR